jgi:glutathione S-transferase
LLYRYSLNIKKLPFETVWLEYPDIKGTLQKIGAKHTKLDADGQPLYTLPAIQDPNTGAVVAESFEIAKYLDKQYPDSGLPLLNGVPSLHAAANQAIEESQKSRGRLGLPLTGHKLNPPSQAYWWPSRAKRVGMPMSEYYPKGEELVKTWKELEEGFTKKLAWLEPGQAFISGSQPGFADCAIAGTLSWFKWLYGPDSAEWKNMVQWDGGRWAKFLEDMKVYEGKP